jgi:hypothetical protein
MEKIARLAALNLSRRMRASSLLRDLVVRDIFDAGRFGFQVTPPGDPTPRIDRFDPLEDYPGAAMVIEGVNFAADRADNRVRIGGRPALVVESEPTRLLVITHHETTTGAVEVEVDGRTGAALRAFTALPWPKPGSMADGPPYSYSGIAPGSGTPPSPGTVSPTGTARILVVNCYPTDLVPPNFSTARQDVVDIFSDVTQFYDQASYSALDVQVDVTDHVALIEDAAYYHRETGDVGYPNIDEDVLAQLYAECAQGATDQGFNLNNYVVMVAAVYLPGLEVRAWGGGSQTSFAYNDGSITINITTSQPIGLIAQRHDADWGRAAHEFAHNMLDPGLQLGEDVYGSDLVDSSEATAADFAMMGNHDSHPLFSSHNIAQLGWYSGAKVLDIPWDRNPYSEEFEVVAHGLSENGDPSRYHLISITVAEGLKYWIEVRQRPGTTAQVFDEMIPLPMGGSPDGGVVVTKVIAGEVNNNHQTRLITLLQDRNRILVTGDVVEDPLRTIRITVVDDNVVARPRVCRVRIEWAQQIAADPDGQFDLRIERWGPGYETEDIWIDRDPFGSYDFTDPSGNPTGNGDEPRPLEINRFYARVHCDGAVDATNVKATYYAVSPPGVGDNGTWTPIDTVTHALIPANGSVQGFVNWVPTVGEHTCLKVAISQQLGEVSGGNNQAQENVFNFQPASASVPGPVKLTVAVRNPLDRETIVFVLLDGVPRGYHVYFPHRWLHMKPLGERQLDLLIIPTANFSEGEYYPARIRLSGIVPRGYSEPLEITGVPASRYLPIGGVTAMVEPKRRGEIVLDEGVEQIDEKMIRICGRVRPAIRDQALRVTMITPKGERQSVIATTDGRGRFCVDFELVREGRGRGEKTLPQGCYDFEAEIFNASQLAPAVSNRVCVKLGG